MLSPLFVTETLTVQPSPGKRRRVSAAKEAQENRLEDVLRVRGVAGHPVCRAEHVLVVLLEDDLESG